MKQVKKCKEVDVKKRAVYGKKKDAYEVASKLRQREERRSRYEQIADDSETNALLVAVMEIAW